MAYKELKFEEGKRLKDYDPSYTNDIKDKEECQARLKEGVKKLAELQDRLYAHDKYGLLIIFQAMDAAGKDGTIKHVMSGVNPQGCQVKSFKSPSSEELDHDYLWRCIKALPERGNIGIFNRSYYEEVLITRVHPEVLKFQKLPNLPEKPLEDEKFWKHRYEEINNFEKRLVNNGIHILKFFLNVSKDEQKRRFLDRINDPTKNWKFTINDIKERGFWKDYQDAYQRIMENTSTKHAPWYVIPADKKWFMRTAVCDIIVDKLKSLDLKYPKVSDAQLADLEKAKKILEDEK